METNQPKSNLGLWIATAIVLVLVIFVGSIGISDLIGSKSSDKKFTITEKRTAKISTEKGDIVIELYPKLMPITCENFIKIVEGNKYSGSAFHRVEDWVIQGGIIEEEVDAIKFETSEQLNHDKYMVGMARTDDPNSATNQFYIVKEEMHSIDGNYAIFGKVIDGTDVVDKIELNDKITGCEMLD